MDVVYKLLPPAIILAAGVGLFFVLPRKISGFMLNALAGLAMLLLANRLGAPIHCYIPINILTAAISFFLGVPGVLLILVILAFL